MLLTTLTPAERAQRDAKKKSETAHRQALQKRSAQVQLAVAEHMANSKCDYDTAFRTVMQAKPELFANTEPPMPPGPAMLLEMQKGQRLGEPLPTGKPTAADLDVARQSKEQFEKLEIARQAVLAALNPATRALMDAMNERAKSFPLETHWQRYGFVAKKFPELVKAVAGAISPGEVSKLPDDGYVFQVLDSIRGFNATQKPR